MIVACSGMIRSGSTLQYNLGRGVVECAGSGTGEGFREPDENEGSWQKWALDDRIHVVKTHRLPANAEELCRSGAMAVVYISRDLREVAASAARIWSLDRDDLFRRLDEAVSTSERVRGMPRALRQKYDEVTADPVRAALEIADFLGLEVTNRQARAVARASSPEAAEMRARELRRTPIYRLRQLARWCGLPRSARRWGAQVLRRLGFSTDLQDETMLVHPDHVATSESPGSGLDPQVLDAIAARYSAWLQEEGYLGSPDEGMNRH